jgi:heme exporter protein A
LAVPHRGQVALRGVPLPAIDPADLCRHLAWLGHEPGLYLDLTALENLSLFARLQGGHADPAALSDRLTRMGIAGSDARRRVRGLSRGMQQRVALARLWLLDEPGTGLDADGLQLLAELVQRARAEGRAIVVASHEFGFLRGADAWCEVRDGRLLAGAPP